MRSHMINSPDGSSKKKQLPPLINGNLEYVLRENPNKTSKFGDDQSSEEEEDTLLPNQNNNKVCKECGKSFQSWKAHIKCHSSINNSVDDDDSWNAGANVNHSKQLLLDSQSDTEAAAAAAAAAPNKKKRSSSRRVKRYIAATTSSSLTVNASPCVSEIDHELQEEVAMSLILLSRDMGNWVGQNHVTTEFSDNNSHLLKNGRTESFQKAEFVGDDEKKKKIRVDNESEVEFASNSEKKFECTSCYKSFNSYQALGGHRVSHKNIKGKNIDLKKEISAIKIESNKKMHECPICFKVFSSGQALGGHKRSHLIADAKRNNNNQAAPAVETRNLLDLNLPAPVEEDNMLDSSIGFQQWWLESSHKHEQLL